MKSKIFVIFDNAAEAYLSPFVVATEGQAMREFRICANHPEHSIAKSPADYTLFCIGEFDDSTANIETFDSARNLGNGLVFVDRRVDDSQMDLLNGKDAPDNEQTEPDTNSV